MNRTSQSAQNGSGIMRKGKTMDEPRPLRVSVLVPAYNEEANVRRAYDAIVEVFKGLAGYDYEIIFTDNHSTDGTFAILQQIARADPRVRVIRFSRNCGYQRSLLTAYKAASGDCSVQIDCDLQDPPHLIPQMLTLWREGHQVVYGVRRSLDEAPSTAFLRRAFYRFISAMSDDDLPLNAGEFRLVDRRILRELRTVDDSSPYLRGLISSMGFSQIGFEYDRQARVAGESKFPFKAMLALAVDGILNHSLLPLRFASLASLIVGTLTFLVLVGYVIGKIIFGQDWPAGFATTTILLLLSMTLNAMFLGIVGEYIGRIFMQIKRRPVPIIEATLNGDVASVYEVTPPHGRTDAAALAPLARD
jgi:dolichol-phosphate mannosyltransferase